MECKDHWGVGKDRMKSERTTPPKLVFRFFRWYCHPKLLKYIEGDLMELYQERVKEIGKRKADLRFIVDVILLFRPGIIKPGEQQNDLNQYDMIKNYLKIGWRNSLNNKALFGINVTGLALGIATCLIIMLFVVDELSFDRYNEKADQIVRVGLNGKVNGEIINEVVTPAPVAVTLKAEFPEVVDATRIRSVDNPKIKYNNITYRNIRLAFVDPNFFDVFTLPFINGDPSTALTEPFTLVITKEQAVKYFGNEDPIGKVLDFVWSNNQYKVTGVIEKVPANSHFHFDMFASLRGRVDEHENSWMNSDYHTYLVLQKGTDIKQTEEKLPGIIEKYMGPQITQIGMTYQKFRENGNEVGFYIQPIKDIHLHSKGGHSELEAGGDVKSVYIFGTVAIFMLLIACTNFMNLATAGATKRSKEVGVKKVLGSQRSQLIYQFLTESFIATGTAMVLALIIVVTMLPVFNQLSGKSLELSFLLHPVVIASLFTLGVMISLVAGSYPAFLLSSIRPILALKSKVSNGGRSKGIRSSLVVFQFVISSVLILAILVVNEQMSFIKNKDVGYDRDQLLILRESHLLGSNVTVFRNQLLSDPRIEDVTRSFYVPAGPSDQNLTGVYPGNDQEAVRRTLFYSIDAHYLSTLKMKLMSGRNFDSADRADSLNVLINEAAVKSFELGENPIGKMLTAAGNNGLKTELTVIGVVKDFHFRSLHESIAPLIMINRPQAGLIVRTKTTDMPKLISDIENKWKAFNTGEPFAFSLLEELYNKTYLAEQKMGTILKIFGVITIFVACLGLFGLVTFAAEQRVKEIGIRKVLGADVTQIVSLLSKDMILLVSLSFVIAFPLGYYLMNIWLQGFAYKIEMQWWVFVLSGLAIVLIAFFTMSLKTLTSALANPINSLRSE